MTTDKKIKDFGFEEGHLLNKKYRILSKLGEGWEGEVYSIEEIKTGIVRAAKFFYPERNNKNKTIIGYAKKLNNLNDAPIIIKYITQEEMRFKGQNILYLVSEYIEATSLETYINNFKKKSIPLFEAVHVFYQLVKGVEQIHLKGEFHGDLHAGNVLLRQKGLAFEIKLIDLFLWKGNKREFQRSDIIQLINIFYEMIGGKKNYTQLPISIKKIICGKKSNIILKRFPRISNLSVTIENLSWTN
jgi:tRNA A-37 threonylcarbamoyl transferase component Bud32